MCDICVMISLLKCYQHFWSDCNVCCPVSDGFKIHQTLELLNHLLSIRIFTNMLCDEIFALNAAM